MSKRKIKVIFTSSGNDGFIDVYLAFKKTRFDCIPLDIRSDAYSLYLQKESYISPPRSQDFILYLIKLAKQKKASILYPLSTDDQLFFAFHKNIFVKAGLKVIVSPLESLKRSINKMKLVKYALKNDILIPRSISIFSKKQFSEALKKLNGYKKTVVLKKTYSTGAQGVKIIFPNVKIEQRIFDRDNIKIPLKDLLFWFKDLEKIPPLLLTEYIEGVEYSVDLIMDGSKVKRGVVRKRIKTHYGLAIVSEVVKRDDILRFASNTAELLKLDYIINVQIIEDQKGRLYLIEINPRIPGSIGLTIAAGCNMPLWVLKRTMGEKVVYRSPIIGEKMTRCYRNIYCQKWK